MSEADRERIASLRDDFDREAQRYERAQQDLQPLTTSDSSGAVHATIDSEGALTQVVVDETWQQRLQPAQVGAAVLEAYAAASAERIRNWGMSVAEAEETRARPAPDLNDSASAQIMYALREREGSAEADGMMDQLLLLLEDLDRGLDEALAQVDATTSREVTCRSGSGHVRAVVSGAGQLTDLTYDERWLEHAHSFNIGREATEAVRDALRRAGDTSVERFVEQGELGRLRRLAQDPAALAQHLGLRD